VTERDNNGSGGGLVKATDVSLDTLAADIRRDVAKVDKHATTAVGYAIAAGEKLASPSPAPTRQVGAVGQ
jgi:hypothetical protein